MKKVIIIGSGFSGMSSACFLAKEGFDVTVLEKNEMAGGRARKFEAEGFVFDMGPSWYWMPDVFERFFESFGKKVIDYYELERLSPSYDVYWADGRTPIPADMSELKLLFESLEPGSGERLDLFLKEAEYKYKVGMEKLVFKPGLSVMEFADWDFLKGVTKLDVFNSISNHIRKYFSHPKLIQLLEFPVLFLGALPENTPALYSLMNYADMVLGTWYPKGGMFKIVEAMQSLAVELGVKFHFNTEVKSISTENNIAKYAETNRGKFEADAFISGADYHHTDTVLLPKTTQNYSEKYWDKRALAPSCLIYYIGLDVQIPQIQHHSLFFDVPFETHANDIYATPRWTEEPLFYLCCPSKTDKTVAPVGKENLFILIPIAPALEDSADIQEHYFNVVSERIMTQTGIDIRKHILFKRAYSHQDFKKDYHAYKGNAYGLANTLMQTAILKPSIKNKKIKNFYYTGQLTVPGPGVPPAIISGEVVAGQLKIES